MVFTLFFRQGYGTARQFVYFDAVYLDDLYLFFVRHLFTCFMLPIFFFYEAGCRRRKKTIVVVCSLFFSLLGSC